MFIIERGRLVNCLGISSGYVKPSDLTKLIIAINNTIIFNCENKLTDELIQEIDEKILDDEYKKEFNRPMIKKQKI